MKRKIPPMPVDFFAIHPKIIGLNTAALGTLTRLLTHFWFTDCSPLPSNDYALFLLSRSHRPTWATHKREIREILDDVCPQLEKAMRIYRQRSSLLDHLRDRAGASKRQKRLEKAIDRPRSIDTAYEPRREERNRSTESVSAKPVGGFVEKSR